MNVSSTDRRRGTILDAIMKHHRQRLPKLMRDIPIADLRALAAVTAPPSDFLEALRTPGVSLIAECKRASPSKGLISRQYDPVHLANTFVRAGASAISVLTDARYFQGSLEHLRDVKEGLGARNSPTTGLPVPVLRKDFVFHPYHVYESRAAGADGILLIAAVLGDGDLKSLLSLTQDLGMAALVEVHTQQELERALKLEPRIIGINNRDLRTFAVDFENTARLRDMIPGDVIVVGESGLKSAEDVLRLAAIGVDAVLVGETLVKSSDPLVIARMFVEAGAPSAPA